MAGKLLWIGSPFFVHSLRDLGWNVVFHNFEDIRLFYWDDILRLAEGPPDLLVVADKSRPPFVLGVENFPCLTAFYAVDTHIHAWPPHFAQAFDLCLVSLKDHLPDFFGGRLPPERIQWSPAFAKEQDRPGQPLPWTERTHELLFVGNVDPETTPGRHAFFQRLAAALPKDVTLTVTCGNYRALYPQAKIVLNEAERGDLNFRVFEALGLESCLLTPAVGHGLDELFGEGRELFTYPQGDAETLAARAVALLAQPERCQDVARAGFQAVEEAHRASHRAAAFTQALKTLDAQALVRERRATATAIHAQYLKRLYLHLAEHLHDPDLKRAYLQAAAPGPKAL